MEAKKLGEALGAAVRTGGPWVVAVVALLALTVILVLPGARADSFTGADGAALKKEVMSAFEKHIEKDAHEGAGRSLAAINARLTAIERRLTEIHRMLEKR